MLLQLLRSLKSPFTSQVYTCNVEFSYNLYKLALRNKVALSYLSHCSSSNPEARKLYMYHYSRYRDLLKVLCNVCDILNKYGFKYAVFKTLRPFDEDIADIDIIFLTNDDIEYKELEQVLRSAGYVVMERGLYCTTFMDPRYRYETELMIDVYKEISVGPFIYLDKKLVLNHVITRHIEGHKVKVLDPIAELLVTIAHSLIKEMEIKLLDYLTALYLIYEIDKNSRSTFIDLVKRAKLTYGTRLFFSIVAYLHKLAYGFISDTIVKLLRILGGIISVHYIVMDFEPPYKLSSLFLTRIYIEKLRDETFVRSVIKSLRYLSSKKSVSRLANRILRHGISQK